MAAHFGADDVLDPLPRDALTRLVFLRHREVPVLVLLSNDCLIVSLRISVHEEDDACTQVHIIVLLQPLEVGVERSRSRLPWRTATACGAPYHVCPTTYGTDS